MADPLSLSDLDEAQRQHALDRFHTIAVQEKDWKNEASLAYWKGDQAIPEASDAQRENTHQQRNRQ